MFGKSKCNLPLWFLQLIFCLSILDEILAEPTIVIDGPYTRNYRTVPNTIEMPLNITWQFSCRWTRQNASQHPFLAIDAPAQRGYCNCQFSTAGKPPQCTPSAVEFATGIANQPQSSNVTCSELGNSLTCSIKLEAFNPRHIGLWSCRSLSDSRNDSAYLQYYKILPDESLVLASWDPIEPSNDTATSSMSATNSTSDPGGNRFECFTKVPVIPPARLAFFLGGIELTTEQSRYPVDWLSSVEYSEQPRMYTLNKTEATKLPRRSDLSMNQQLLSASRTLQLRLRRSYNSLLLECRASQELATGRAVARSIVLHLDSSNSGSTLRFDGTARSSVILWLCVYLIALRSLMITD